MRNILLICLAAFNIIVYSSSSPICCQNANHYADFLVALECRVILCKNEEIIGGESSFCVTCSPKVLPVQDAAQGLSELKIRTPQSICQYVEKKNETLLGSLVLTWPWKDNEHPSIVFMIEARSSYLNRSEWNFVGMTNETFADVSNLNLKYKYQFRITSITSSKSLFQPKLSDWIALEDSSKHITAPTGVDVTKFKLRNNYLEALVTWNASKEKPCAYKVFWFLGKANDYFEQLTVELPGDSLYVVLHSLLFETNYTVIVLPQDPSKSRNVQSVEASFVTPSCFEATGSNFSLCAPGPPLNVSIGWLTTSEAVLTWLRPVNVSAQNAISGYHIVVEEDTGHYKKVLRYKTTLFVGPNSTNTTVSNLKYLSHYVFGIQAVSRGGAGVSSVVELNSKSRSVTSLNIHSMPFHFIVPFLIVPIITLVALAVRITCKRYRKKEVYPSGVADVNDDIRPFLIASNKVELKEIVGQGAFGTVHRGIYFRNKSTDEVAVKVYPSETINRHQMLHEVNMLRVLGRHEHIVGFIGFTLSLDKMSLLFEYCKIGNLHSHLISLKPELMYMKSLPITERPLLNREKGHGLRLASYIHQVAKGMEYVSSLKIVHRDIAARNILMLDEQRVKIGDFGLSKEIYQNKYYKTLTEKRFPIKWMAPEAIEKQKFSTYSDVWSFGVFMWEVFRLGKEPYPGIDCGNILLYLKMGYRMEKPHCSDNWYSIMKLCWSKIPHERPNFTELVNMIGAIIESSTHYVVLL
ncbi:hypothetical protein JTE90_019215 [Oedothorax gibbosus]|uniref:receptor protein-tyrosine kinase n=1 Tax=Oedothorax gibbosus TaxID=931172 RepID=A0AAV6UDF5_9ARAC|nr:hypothetical protein JTE90_019215 [Oedothorax gibbosus]